VEVERLRTYDTAGQEEESSQTVEKEHYGTLEKCSKDTGEAHHSSHYAPLSIISIVLRVTGKLPLLEVAEEAFGCGKTGLTTPQKTT